MKQTVYVIDFDGVLYDQHRTEKLYPEAINVVKHLKSRDKVLAIATRRNGVEAQEMTEILKSANIHDHFEAIIFNPCPKPWHIQKILNYLKIKYPNTIFHATLYDDFDVNINDITLVGHKGVLINNRYGLRFSDIS